MKDIAVQIITRMYLCETILRTEWIMICYFKIPCTVQTQRYRRPIQALIPAFKEKESGLSASHGALRPWLMFHSPTSDMVILCLATSC